MNVSWKQSSASVRPTDATRKRHTASRCSSRNAWNGGGAELTKVQRVARAFREASSIFEEARARGAAGAPGRDHPPQRRRRPVALLAVLAAERLEHGEHVVEADRIGPLQRPARMAQPELHPRVDVGRPADAFAE